MGGRGSSANRNSITPTVKAPFDTALSYSTQISWLQANLGYDKAEAEATVGAFLRYSSDQDIASAIHSGELKRPIRLRSGVYTEKDLQEDIANIEKYINNPKLIPTKRTLHRGLFYSGTAQDLEKSLATGYWKESGVTSFSTSSKHAKDFLERSGVNVLVRLENNKTAVPIGHLSYTGGESESLYPFKKGDKGLKIVSWTKRSSNRGKVTLYEITVRDT